MGKIKNTYHLGKLNVSFLSTEKENIAGIWVLSIWEKSQLNPKSFITFIRAKKEGQHSLQRMQGARRESRKASLDFCTFRLSHNNQIFKSLVLRSNIKPLLNRLFLYTLPHENPNNITYLLFQGLELFQADKECLLWSQKRDHLIFQTVKGYSDLAALKKKTKGRRGNNRSTYICIFFKVLMKLL